MRGKLAKQLRRQVKKEMGVTAVTAEYGQHATQREVAGGFDDKGEQIILKAVTVVSTLTETCSRKVYQKFKKQVKAAA